MLCRVWATAVNYSDPSRCVNPWILLKFTTLTKTLLCINCFWFTCTTIKGNVTIPTEEMTMVPWCNFNTLNEWIQFVNGLRHTAMRIVLSPTPARRLWRMHFLYSHNKQQRKALRIYQNHARSCSCIWALRRDWNIVDRYIDQLPSRQRCVGLVLFFHCTYAFITFHEAINTSCTIICFLSGIITWITHYRLTEIESYPRIINRWWMVYRLCLMNSITRLASVYILLDLFLPIWMPAATCYISKNWVASQTCSRCSDFPFLHFISIALQWTTTQQA